MEHEYTGMPLMQETTWSYNHNLIKSCSKCHGKVWTLGTIIADDGKLYHKHCRGV